MGRISSDLPSYGHAIAHKVFYFSQYHRVGICLNGGDIHGLAKGSTQAFALANGVKWISFVLSKDVAPYIYKFTATLASKSGILLLRKPR